MGCRGSRVPRPDAGEAETGLYGASLAHLDDDRGTYLASLRPGSDLDHRSTAFNSALMRHLLDAVRDPIDRQPHFGAVYFEGATFEAGVVFDGATFEPEALFLDATFKAHAGFRGATFKGDAMFYRTRFDGDALFDEAMFEGSIWFSGGTFGRDARFDKATFRDYAGFDNATFRLDAVFSRARFENARFVRARFKGDVAVFDVAVFRGNVMFDHARFQGMALFDWARSEGDAKFRSASFKGVAKFAGASFQDVSQFGSLACRGTVDLTAATFSTAVTLEISANRVDCRRTCWTSTAALRIRHALIDLSDAILEYPMSVTAHPPFTAFGRNALDESGLIEAPVHVASLQGLDASHLVLTDVDWSGCRFAGTIHLDQLRLHGLCTLAPTPDGVHRRGLVPVRWTSRQTLAEEHHWRATRQRAAAGWAPEPDGGPSLKPAALAPVYRELRKGFEDAKNEPGAADFYGEMEMRRHNPLTPRPERLLLWLYWTASGYGLLASRALGWLVCAMTVTVLLMVGIGLPDTPAKPYPPGAGVIGKQNPELRADFPGRFITARAEKAAEVVVNSVVFRSSGQALTTAGRYTEMTSRFTEPILLSPLPSSPSAAA